MQDLDVVYYHIQELVDLATLCRFFTEEKERGELYIAKIKAMVETYNGPCKSQQIITKKKLQ